MKTTLLICFAVALFLSLIKKRRARQYESDVKDTSPIITQGRSRGLRCESPVEIQRSEAFKKVMKEVNEALISPVYPKHWLTNPSIINANKAELISQKLTALVDEGKIAKKHASPSFNDEITNLWFKQNGLQRTGLKYLMITEDELLDFAEHYHKAKS